MKPKCVAACALLCGLLGIVARAGAAPVQWKVEDGGNGHFYSVVGVARGISWADANAATVARGSGWHLATITSAEENAFVYGLVAGKPQFWKCCKGLVVTGPWLGAQRSGAGGAFSWVGGEAFTYTNWADGQPGAGDRVTLSANNVADSPQWAVSSGTRSDVVSYVMETEQPESIVAAVEQPTCLGVAGISDIRGFAYSSINGISLDRVVGVTFDRDTPKESRADLACCSSRADVHAVDPVAPIRSGFSGVFNWCLLTPGKHTISLLFESNSGQTLTLTRDFISRCEHASDAFLAAGEFDWDAGADACVAGAGGTLVCRTKKEICNGQVRYRWDQASQGLMLDSNCVADASNPPPPPACSETITYEVGTSD